MDCPVQAWMSATVYDPAPAASTSAVTSLAPACAVIPLEPRAMSTVPARRRPASRTDPAGEPAIAQNVYLTLPTPRDQRSTGSPGRSSQPGGRARHDEHGEFNV